MKSILLSITLAVAAGYSSYGQEKAPIFHIEQVQKLPNEVYQLVFNPVDNQVYVAGPQKRSNKDAENYIYVLDGKSLSLKDSLSLGKYAPFGLSINTKTQTLYAGHSFQNAISALDLRTRKQTVINSGKEKSKIREVAVDEIRNKVYVSDHGNPSIWEVDGKTNTYIRSFDQPDAFLLGLTVDPKKGRVYSTNSGTMEGSVMVYNSESGKLETRFKTWSYCPLNVALDRTNDRIFVSQSNDNNVTVLNASTGEILQKVYLGNDAAPVGLVYDEGNNLLYMANRGNHEVAVIDGKTLKIVERVPTKGLPNTIALDPASGAVYVTNKQASRDDNQLENGNTVVKITKTGI